MPYTGSFKWELDHARPKEQSFDNHTGTPVTSFHLDVFARENALRPPQQLLTAQFTDATVTQFDFEEVIKYWMDNPTEFIPKENKAYCISWFRELFSLLKAMFFQLYGLPNCTYFKVEWAPISYHILITGESFNWA